MGCLVKLFKGVVAIVLTILILASIARLTSRDGTETVQETVDAQTVITRAPATTGIVQLFDAITVDADVVALVPDGSRCSILEQAQEVVIEGMTMRFYRVDCRGKRGYVNAKWVAVD